MGMCKEERLARDLLRQVNAQLKRVKGHHEIWELPNGHHHVLANGGSEPRRWKNNLSQLRHNLNRQGRDNLSGGEVTGATTVGSLSRAMHPPRGSSAGSGKFVLGPRGFALVES